MAPNIIKKVKKAYILAKRWHVVTLKFHLCSSTEKNTVRKLQFRIQMERYTFKELKNSEKENKSKDLSHIEDWLSVLNFQEHRYRYSSGGIYYCFCSITVLYLYL